MSDKPKVFSIKDKKAISTCGTEADRPVEFIQITCNCRDWPHFVWEATSNGWLTLNCTACGYPHLPSPNDFEKAVRGEMFGPELDPEIEE